LVLLGVEFDECEPGITAVIDSDDANLDRIVSREIHFDVLGRRPVGDAADERSVPPRPRRSDRQVAIPNNNRFCSLKRPLAAIGSLERHETEAERNSIPNPSRNADALNLAELFESSSDSGDEEWDTDDPFAVPGP
jgi:hypothetical protein